MENKQKSKAKIKQEFKTPVKRGRGVEDFPERNSKRVKKSKESEESCSLKIKNEKPSPKREHLDDDFSEVAAKKFNRCEPGSSRITTKIEKNEPLWDDYELLAEAQNLTERVAHATVQLFENGNTIPFIARYRKDVTENLTSEQLRDIKDEYDKIIALKEKTQTVIKNIDKVGHLDLPLKKAILSAHTMEELEHIYAPYKPGKKQSLAERAKQLGLEHPALWIIDGSQHVHLEDYVDKNNKNLQSAADVEKGLMHIIASVIATDTEVLSFLRKLRAETYFTVESKKAQTKKDGNQSKSKTKEKEGKQSKVAIQKNVDENKFSIYFDFKAPAKFIKPHQILALNRGEALKILSIKIVVPDMAFNRYKQVCAMKWIDNARSDYVRAQILEKAADDAYTRLVQPHIIREVRADLKLRAEKASYEVFTSNLKQLLLMPPLKGKLIMGIDPGFSNGCKVAVISETGSLLESAVVYPHTSKGNSDIKILNTMLQQYNCSIIALGNGTACRETETWISDLLQKKTFAPLDVTYTIVNESGASIYSCSPEAKKEFPTLDPNIISAVSLARRVQEPLAELVKVEPKHLGVGMYQHDLPKKQLEQALDEVVMECVSFVGVDLNTASQCLLRRIAGLTDKRATQVIEHREKNGMFMSRKQLLDVKGIGPRVFEQCAGFLRVGPATASQSDEFYKYSAANRLDCTYIHPESYDVASKIVKQMNLDIKNIGQQEFISTVQSKSEKLNVNELSSSLKSSVETVKLILEAFNKPLNFDLRTESSQTPLFKKGLTNLSDLKVGCVLTGSITNITSFGCFVDVGVGPSGLIHQSKLNGFNPQIGERVKVEVINLEIERKRIGLLMIDKI